MGAEQSTEPRTVTMENEIEVLPPVLCTTFGERYEEPAPPREKRGYSEEETDKLAAKLDPEYVAWIKEVDKHNEQLTRQVRDELIKKSDEVYERFAYVEAQPICQKATMAVQNCYEQNKDRTLNCTEEVRYFTECVLKHQMEYNKSEHGPKPVAKNQ